MSKKAREPDEWYIELGMDHADRTYTVRKVAKTPAFPYTPPFFLKVAAEDEIGAFNVGQKILAGLGFRPEN